jgi:hypothetical protein
VATNLEGVCMQASESKEPGAVAPGSREKGERPVKAARWT